MGAARGRHARVLGVALHAQIVNVALPDIGARRAYGLGMGVFVLASAACGLAPSLGVLVAARVAQGVGAALITPTSLALIREAYDDARRRAKAVAYWALGGSVAAAAGPILGGILTELDWRVIFLVNLPVGALALTLLARVPDSVRRPRPFDIVGQLTAVVALVGCTYAVIEGGSHGYGDPKVIAAFVLAALGAVAFLVSQARGSHPMVPLDLFRARPVAILNPTAARTALRFGSRVPIIGGQVLMVLGLLGLATAPVDLPLGVIALLMVPVGVGGSIGVAASGAVIAHLGGSMSGLRCRLVALAVLVAATARLSLLLPRGAQDAA